MIGTVEVRVLSIYHKITEFCFTLTMTIAKTQLKQEIDCLDDQYVELVYKILCQFPHFK